MADVRSTGDRLAAAAARLDAPAAEAWRPDDRASGHPQAIVGEVVETSVRVGGGYNGEDVNVVTVRQTNGVELAVFCFGKVLREHLAGVQYGDVVAIRFEGKKEGRDATYNSYRVVVDRAGAAAAPTAVPATTPTAPPVEREREPAPPVPPPAEDTCGACGFRGGHHAAGCPNDDIPF